MSVTDEIKSRIDIVSYVQQYVPLKKAGRYYKACCPFHSEKTPSFVVNPDMQSWRCFGACAEGGDLFSFAMKFHGVDFKEALEQLGKQAGVEVRKQTPEDHQRADHQEKLRGLLKTAADIYSAHLLSDSSDDVRRTLGYTMEKRGFTLETIKTFGIGFAPDGWQHMLEELGHLGYEEALIIEAGMAIRNDQGRLYDRFRNRLMVPIRDERGRVVGFGARALDPDDNPKYLNSPQTPVFDKSRLLFGLDTAKNAIRETETAVIVEGYMDAIQAQQAGFMNVVAQMGTAFTEAQLRLIAPRYAKKIILALDADDAGQNATRRSLETARQTLAADFSGKLSVDIRVLQIPDAKDPDDLIRENPEAWQGLVGSAVPVADFVIDMETAGLPADASVQAREEVARRVLPILVATESNLYKQENLQKLALRLRFPERDLLDMAEEQARAERDRKRAQERAQSRKQQPPPPRLKDDEAGPPPNYIGAEGDFPPPLDLDQLEPPPYDTGDTGDEAGAPVAEPTQGDALEAYCLRMLIMHPNVFYAVNRKFRELAGDNEILGEGPLQDLCAADFTNGHYRVLMEAFLAALNQDDMDVLEFIVAQVEPGLRAKLDVLLVDEQIGMRDQIQQRFGGDLSDLMKDFDRRVRPALDPVEEFVGKALSLRRGRLNREIHEFGFMQRGMGQSQDYGGEDIAQTVGSRIVLSRQARQLLDAELQRQLNYFL